VQPARTKHNETKSKGSHSILCLALEQGAEIARKSCEFTVEGNKLLTHTPRYI